MLVCIFNRFKQCPLKLVNQVYRPRDKNNGALLLSGLAREPAVGGHIDTTRVYARFFFSLQVNLYFINSPLTK